MGRPEPQSSIPFCVMIFYNLPSLRGGGIRKITDFCHLGWVCRSTLQFSNRAGFFRPHQDHASLCPKPGRLKVFHAFLRRVLLSQNTLPSSPLSASRAMIFVSRSPYRHPAYPKVAPGAPIWPWCVWNIRASRPCKRRHRFGMGRKTRLTMPVGF